MLGKKRQLQIEDATVLNQEPINSIIGKDLIIKGELQGDGTVRVDGRVEGNITLQRGLIVGDGAFVIGDVKTENLIVYGKLTGNIFCKSIQIKSSGNIKGDIHTEIILIETGGKYNGQLYMQDEVNSLENSIPKTLHIAG
ncbi:bactofilin family protein [Niabella ginsengisoli]|uniref:Polymer-forming cytoskeletal protein n=1 Tax=Niabella ginsengisoli TaxID=522298 RepID=A0ABS9SQ06_9BACT|nr:polymer-forming cytoskeletal protein [Niabella ginsengisoli]MCH5600199.1 polymer-forming cytoskeletal protein [Niabella ginsengisoli]